MKKRIIIGAIIVAALPSICLGQPANERRFVCFVEMTAGREFKAVDEEIRLDQESTLIIVARGYYVKYLVKDSDGNVINEEVLWGEEGQPTVRITAAGAFSWDDLVSKWKDLYPGLPGVELNDDEIKTIILKDVTPEGEILDVRYRLTEGGEFYKEFGLSRPLLIKFVSGKKDGPFEYVGEKKWLDLNKTLFLALRGYNIRYQIMKEDGGVGEPFVIPWTEKPRKYFNEEFLKFCKRKFRKVLKPNEYQTIDFTGKARDGDTVIITWENVKNPAEAESQTFKLIKSRWVVFPLQSFSVNTVFNIELGKKKAAGEKSPDLSAGPGLNLPGVFYRFPDSDVLDKLGLALNVNAAPTEILNEETQQTENVYVWTGGALGVIKFKASPVLLLLGVGYSLNGDDKYWKISFGFGAELTQ